MGRKGKANIIYTLSNKIVRKRSTLADRCLSFYTYTKPGKIAKNLDDYARLVKKISETMKHSIHELSSSFDSTGTYLGIYRIGRSRDLLCIGIPRLPETADSKEDVFVATEKINDKTARAFIKKKHNVIFDKDIPIWKVYDCKSLHLLGV